MNHASLIPLVGGAAIGASLALGKPPRYLASWSAFAHNDFYAAQYYPDTTFYTIPDGGMINTSKMPKVDIVTCVPPCSGLSTATPSTSRGCQAPQNEHMLRVAEIAMLTKTPAILIENAPALYSAAGEPFAKRFLPLCKKYGYSMVLVKTSSILHGLPQNRVRSFVILWRGKMIPEWQWIKKDYVPLYRWPIDKRPTLATSWNPKEDEMVQVIKKYYHNDLTVPLENITGLNYDPLSMWNIFNKAGIKHRFKTKPYKYMQQTSATGAGIMDRSPIVVYGHSNALMWKSAHRMLNPSTGYSRQFSIRELMSLMGLPKDFEEIPAKDINVLFQNVPVNTVATMVEEMAMALDGQRKWYRPTQDITRLNNIKQTIEVWN